MSQFMIFTFSSSVSYKKVHLMKGSILHLNIRSFPFLLYWSESEFYNVHMDEQYSWKITSIDIICQSWETEC